MSGLQHPVTTLDAAEAAVQALALALLLAPEASGESWGCRAALLLSLGVAAALQRWPRRGAMLGPPLARALLRRSEALAWLSLASARAGDRYMAGAFLAANSFWLTRWELGLLVSLWARLGDAALAAAFCAAAALGELLWELRALPRPGRREGFEEDEVARARADTPDWSVVAGFAAPMDWQRRTFQEKWPELSRSEVLVAVYSISVRLTLTCYGSLYLSTGHVCFVGSMSMASFCVDLQNVVEVRCGASQDSAQLIFASPMRLNLVTYSKLQLSGLPPGSLAVLMTIFRRKQLDSEDEDEMYDVGRLADVEGKDEGLQRSGSLPFPSFDDGDPFQLVLESVIEGHSLARLVAEALGESWSDDFFLNKAHFHQGATENQVSEALAGEGGENEVVKFRELTFVMPLPPAPMTPKTSHVTCTVKCVAYTPPGETAESQLTIETSTRSHDVPFGNNFLTQNRLVFTTVPEGLLLKNYARIMFLQSCSFLTGTIRKAAMKGVADAAPRLVTCLLDSLSAPSSPAQTTSPEPSDADARTLTDSLLDARAASMGSLTGSFSGSMTGSMTGSVLSASMTQASVAQRSRGGVVAKNMDGKKRAVFVLKVYELQRRHPQATEWRAPFLPHDRLRAGHAWRWVDMSFQKHPWTSAGSLQQAQLSETPPIEPGGGWQKLGAWRVACNPEETDDEGWQYANNFYRDTSLWSPNSWGCLVRKRLWTCEFMEQQRSSC